jgi:hypothetical protein
MDTQEGRGQWPHKPAGNSGNPAHHYLLVDYTSRNTLTPKCPEEPGAEHLGGDQSAAPLAVPPEGGLDGGKAAAAQLIAQ